MFRTTKVFVVALLVMAIAAPAFATTSRVQALAGTGNYINDDSNIFRWYGTLPSYTRMVMGEFGQAVATGGSSVDSQYQALGFTHNWGEDHWLGTWAVFLLNHSVEDNSFFAGNPTPTLGGATGIDGLTVPTTKFVLMWGNEIDMFSWGITFTRSDQSVEDGSTTLDLSFTTLGGGIRVDVGEDLYADAAITVAFAGSDNVIAFGDTLSGFDSSNGWDLALRAFWEAMDNVTVVPFFGWSSAAYALDAPAQTYGSNGYDYSDVTLGGALHFDVNTSNTLIGGAELEWVNNKWKNAASGDQSELKVTHLPKLFVALESDINSWLTTRVGATKTMAKVETKNPAGNSIITTAPATAGDDFSWYLGAGFHIGDWDIDAVLNHDVPFRLGYWLTGFGVDDADPPIGRISGTYRF